jgi:spore germination protein KA
VCLIYIEGIANPELVKEMQRRIGRIRTDSILAEGYLEQYIEDSPFSVFPTVGYSEKPDVVAGRLLEGRVAVVVDGSPIVLTAPMLFIECFQTAGTILRAAFTGRFSASSASSPFRSACWARPSMWR